MDINVTITLSDKEELYATACYQQMVDSGMNMGMGNPDITFEDWISTTVQGMMSGVKSQWAQQARESVIRRLDTTAVLTSATAAWKRPVKISTTVDMEPVEPLPVEIKP